MQNLEAFRELISKPKKVVITTHHKPDADALGSSLGLSAYLKAKGHEVTVITPTDYPNFLNWMAGNDDVVIFSDGNQERSGELVADADVIFCLDFSSLHRIDELGEYVAASDSVKVLIDHHLEPDNFARFKSWSNEAAATAELVYELICDLGDRAMITTDIAEALYAGIMTDTGSFKHPNTTENVFRVCGELISLGADAAKVAKLVYDNNSIDRIKFIGFALNERLKVIPDLHTAYFAISREDLNRFNSRTGDTEGLVNYALSIAGIKFAALITEREDAVKMSFRSIGDFSVNEFAAQHFSGGGHKNAAGGKSDDTLEKTVEKFEGLLQEYKDQLSIKLKAYV